MERRFAGYIVWPGKACENMLPARYVGQEVGVRVTRT